jgi:hypothetical protein
MEQICIKFGLQAPSRASTSTAISRSSAGSRQSLHAPSRQGLHHATSIEPVAVQLDAMLIPALANLERPTVKSKSPTLIRGTPATSRQPSRASFGKISSVDLTFSYLSGRPDANSDMMVNSRRASTSKRDGGK